MDKTNLQKELEAMDKGALIAHAAANYNLSIDAQLDNEVIIAELLRIDDDNKAAARGLNEKSGKLVEHEKDPLIKVQFIRLDFANANHEFYYDSGRGIINKKRSAVQKAKDNKLELPKLPYCPGYNLFSGHVYDLPMSVVKHLNSRIYIDNQPVVDAQTGMFHGNRPVMKPRFIVKPELTDEQMMSLSKTESRKG